LVIDIYKYWNYYLVAMAARPLTARSFLFSVLALSVVISPCNANKKPPPAPINLNTATSEELQQVPGIGPVTADKILQMRKSYGAFKSVDDLRAVRGIGPKRLEKMRKYLTVGKTAASQNKPASANKPATPPKPATTPRPSTVPADPPDPSL
jgi:comEA protein